MTQLISILSLISLLACSQSGNGRSPHSIAITPDDKVKTDDKKSQEDDAEETKEGGNGKSEDLKKDPVVIEEPEIKEPEMKNPVIADCYKGDAFICQIEKFIDEETNKLRVSSSKLPLLHAGGHSFISRQWSEFQASQSKISHEGFPQDRVAAFKKEFGTNALFLAENVAIITSSKTDAQSIAKQIVTMWWGSAGHKVNMLGNFKNIGSGVAKKGNDYYATQLYSN